MAGFRNTTDCIDLIKFCADLNDLADLRSIVFAKSDEMDENELESEQSESKIELTTTNTLSNYLVLLVKLDSLNINLSSNPHEAIRNELKKNLFLSNIWHVTILYVS